MSNLDIHEPRAPRFKFTVDQYHEMMGSGLIEEGAPYELLDGQIVRKDRSASGEDPVTINFGHTRAVMALDRLGPKFRSRGCHIRCQQPITIPEFDEPEPDGLVARGDLDDYNDHHPSGSEILCVIEVADASLNRDRTIKLALYANAGIPTYMIVNLRERVVEVYRGPIVGKGLYGSVDASGESGTIAIPTARKALTVRVRDLLPPAGGSKLGKGRRR